MCRACQSCLETIYWHLIEKRFCYDESIALYEEPQPREKEKNNNMFDNMAFYDSVAVIAGRAVVTIDPLPLKNADDQPIIVKQPTRSKVRWMTEEDEENKINEEKSQRNGSKENIPIINETPVEEKEEKEEEKPTVTVDILIEETKPIEETLTKHQSMPDITLNVIKPQTPKSRFLKPEEPVKTRKKSLKERRQSRCASLNFENLARDELPMIKQNSMPKFYMDTPDIHQLDSSIIRSPSTTLSSPVRPNTGQFNYDLKSIVEMENHRLSHNFHSSAEPINRPPKHGFVKMVHKVKLVNIMKHASTNSLPNTVNHI